METPINTKTLDEIKIFAKDISTKTYAATLVLDALLAYCGSVNSIDEVGKNFIRETIGTMYDINFDAYSKALEIEGLLPHITETDH